MAEVGKKVILALRDGKVTIPVAASQVRVEVVDVDLLLILPDGTQIVIPGGGIAALSGEGGVVEFSDAKVPLATLFGKVGEVRSLKDSEKLDIASVASPDWMKANADPVAEKPVKPAEQSGGAEQGADARMQAAQLEAAVKAAVAEAKRAAARAAASSEPSPATSAATPSAAAAAPPQPPPSSGSSSQTSEPKLPATSFAFSAPETLPGGREIGSMFEQGSNLAGRITFTPFGPDTDKFVIDGAGKISLAPGARLDYETKTQHVFQAVATGGGIKPTVVEIVVSVVDVNEPPEPPVFVLGGSIVENSEGGSVVGQVASKDPEGPATVQYSLDDDAGGRFVIDAKSGIVTVARDAKIDFEKDAAHSIVVRATDNGGLTSSAKLDVRVIDVNEAPSVPEISGLKALPENCDPDTLVFTANSTDPDKGDGVRYSLVADGGGKFVVDPATGRVTVAKGAKIDFEATPKLDVVVRASDKFGLYSDKAVVIEVSDINEKPGPIQLVKQFALTEKSAPGADVATVKAIDPDANDVVRYSLTVDKSGRFAIDPTTGRITLTGALNIANGNEFHVKIRATDKGGLYSEQDLVISVRASSNVPVNPDTLVFRVNENSPAGAEVGVVPTNGSVLGFSLTEDAGGRFVIDPTTGLISVAPGAVLDYEKSASHPIELLLTTASEPFIYKAIVALQDVNEAPSTPAFINGGAVLENAPNGATVGIVKAEDPEREPLRYELIDDDGGRFAIDAATGEVTVRAGVPIRLEDGAVRQIVVRVTDRVGQEDSLSAEARLAIEVRDVNDPPKLDAFDDLTIAENPAPGTIIATARATDPDARDTISYSLIESGGGLFSINSQTGVISVAPGAVVNYEALGPDRTITLRVRATDAALASDEKTLKILVTDLPEAPKQIAFVQDAPLREDASPGAVVGTATAFDEDAGAIVRYALDPSSPAGFAIDQATGRITLTSGAALDFETRPTITLKVIATDETERAFSQSVSVAIADINEAPTNLALVGGNVVAGASAFGRLVANDQDRGDRLSYTLETDASGLFQVDALTGAVSLKPGATPTLSGYQLGVKATDLGGLSTTATVDILFRTSNTAPSEIISDSVSLQKNYLTNGSFENFRADALGSIAGGQQFSGNVAIPGWAITSGSAAIVRGQTLVSDGAYALMLSPGESGGAGIEQSLDNLRAGERYRVTFSASSNVQIFWNGVAAIVSPVQGAAGLYETTLVASGASGRLGFQTSTGATIDAVQVVVAAGREMSVAEGALAGTEVGRIRAVDADFGETFRYELTNAEGRFSINADGSIIVLNGALLDYEVARVRAITVKVIDSGNGQATQSFEIAINNVTGQIVGDNQANVLVGTGEEDFMLAFDGDDTLRSSAGADTIVGGAGNDTVDYATSKDPVRVNLGSSGAQSGGDAQGDVLSSIEKVVGSAFDDRITGDDGANTLNGGRGDDTIDGGGGLDVLIGGDGDDVFIVRNEGVTVTEADGGGRDTIQTMLQDYRLPRWVEVLQYTGSDSFRGVGNELDNEIIGGGSDDTLIGGAGADVLRGGGGTDTADYGASKAGVTVNLGLVGMQASDGDADGDTLIDIENVVGASRWSNTLIGSGAANRLVGGAIADVLDAGAAGGAGDTLVGGDGNDTYWVSNTSDQIVETSTGGTDSVRSRVRTFTLADFVENLRYEGPAGGGLALSGNDLANRIDAGAGSGRLNGLGGNDTLVSGAGSDTLDGGDGVDTADYSAYSGDLTIDLGSTSAQDGANGDVLVSIENVIGSTTRRNVITGNGDRNLLIGGSDADRLDGGGGADTLDGGAGDDVYVIDNAGDEIRDSAGLDRVETGLATYTLSSQIENLTLTRAQGATGIGNGGANSILGGAGNDILAGLGGADTLDGGEGAMNIADYSSSDGGVNIDLTRETQIGGDAEGDRLVRIQGVYGSSRSPNTLMGDDAGNSLLGGSGNDTIDGRGGADTMEGGGGDDVYYVDDLGDVVIERGNGGYDKVYTTVAGWVKPDNVEELIYVGPAIVDADYAAYVDMYPDLAAAFAAGSNPGWGATKALWGQNHYANVGRNEGRWLQTGVTIQGSSSVDVLTGAAGGDRFVGSGAADRFNGAGGLDAADYRTSAVGVTVDLARSGGQLSQGDASGDTLVNIENVLGSVNGPNRLSGDAGANVLVGGPLRDFLDGRGGDDVMVGGLGDDVYVIDSTRDRIIDHGGFDEVIVPLATYTLPGNLEALTYSGAATFTGTGNNTHNIIIGGKGADVLSGLGGNDLLVGDYDPANLLRDGSFEETLYAGRGIVGPYWTLGGTGAGGVSFLPNWGGDGFGRFAFGGWANDSGATLSQTVATKVGQSYTVSFTFNGGGVLNGVSAALRVEALGLTRADLNQTVNVNTATLTTRTFTFTASSERTTIQFTDLSPTNNPWDINFDNVSLVEGPSAVAFAGGADTLIGGTGGDRLYGGAGDDVLRGGESADLIDGGAGIDTADYSDSPGGETVSLALPFGAAQTSANWANGDILRNIENLTGSNFGDTLTGDSAANVLRGLGGNDTLVGNAGDDTLDGGAGADVMTGGSGDDVYYVDDPGDSVVENAGGGDDLIFTGMSRYTLPEQIERLAYTGGASFSGTGNNLGNIMTGRGAADVLDGAGGDDVLAGLGGADTLKGGDGNDAADYSQSAQGVIVDLTMAGRAQVSPGDADGDVFESIESVFGSLTGSNILIGDANGNALTGGNASDTLRGGAGADTLTGAGGFDVVDYSTSAAPVTVDLGRATAQISTGDASGDVLSGIEGVTGSRFSDVLTGTVSPDLLEGDPNLIVNGEFAFGPRPYGRVDSAWGWRFEGTREGGIWNTYGATQADANRFSLGANGALGGGILSQDIQTEAGKTYTLTWMNFASGTGWANAVLEASAIDGAGAVLTTTRPALTTGWGTSTLTFTAQSSRTTIQFYDRSPNSAVNWIDIHVDNVRLYADQGGNDLLVGGAGNDDLYGGGGGDTLRGGAGSDRMWGGGGIDTADYSDADRSVFVDLTIKGGAGQRGQSSIASGDVLVDIENVRGSNFSDRLTGEEGANSLSGGGGGDTLAGLAGADTLDGGAGSDAADYSASSAGVKVNLTTGAISGGDAEGDVLISIENVIGSNFDDELIAGSTTVGLAGGGGADRLVGNSGANVLIGGDGNDSLEGGAGNDRLYGGAGDDVIASGSASSLAADPVAFANANGLVYDSTVRRFYRIVSTPTSWEDANAAAFATVVAGIPGRLARIDSAAAASAVVGARAGNGNWLFTGGSDVQKEGEWRWMDGPLPNDQFWQGDQNGVLIGAFRPFATSEPNGGRGENYIASGSVSGLGVDAGTSWDAGYVIEWDLAQFQGDLVDGGAGQDTADYSESASGVTVDLRLTGAQSSAGDAAGDTLVSIENVIGSKAGGNRLTGDANDNMLGAGAAADTLDGGAGIDVADYSKSTTGIVVNLATGVRTGAWLTGDVWTSIEGVRGSATASNTLTGDLGANRLIGGGAADQIDGGDGNDTIAGGGGADTLIGGAGTDTVVFSGRLQDYTVTQGTDARGAFYQFVDNRQDAPAGATRTYSFESYQFANVTTPVPLNSAPTSLALASGGSVVENAATGTAVAQMNATDPDTGDQLRYSLVSNGGGRFDIDPMSGLITVASGATIDFESSPVLSGTTRGYSLQVRVTDLGGLTRDATVAVAVTDVNEAPTDLVWSSGGTVRENSAQGVVVGNLRAVDQDPNETFTYSLTSNPGNLFAIDANTGRVTVASATGLDFDSNPTQTVRVRVLDSFNNAFERDIAIGVTNVNEAPVFVSSVAVAIATKQDGQIGAQTNLTPATQQGMDFTTTGPVTIAMLGAFDSGGDGFSAPMTVRLYDRSTQSVLAEAIVPAGASAQLIGGFRYVTLASPVVLPQGFQGSIQAFGFSATDTGFNSGVGGNAASLLALDGAPGVTVSGARWGAATGWPGGSSATAVVGNGSFAAPAASASLTVNENTGGVIYRARAVDPDVDSVVRYSLSGADALLFNIDPVSGELRFRDLPNFENPGDSDKDNSYLVNVVATDGQLSSSLAVTVRVQNVDEAPAFASSTRLEGQVNEHDPNATWSFAASDPEQGQVAYSIAGADAGLFQIDAAGTVRFRDTPDWEDPKDVGRDNIYDFVVRATDPNGNVSERAARIEVKDVQQTVTGGSPGSEYAASAESERFVGDGSHIVSYASATGAVTVFAGNSGAGGSAGWANGDTFEGIAKVIGSQFNDVFDVRPNSGIVFDGGDGVDTVRLAANSGQVTSQALATGYTNIERIDATAANVSAQFDVTSDWIQSLTGKTGAAAVLELRLDSNDSVNLVGATQLDTNTYTFMSDSNVELARLQLNRI